MQVPVCVFVVVWCLDARYRDGDVVWAMHYHPGVWALVPMLYLF